MTVQNADMERAINKKANLNFRIQKQIEESKQEQHSQDNDIKVQDSKSKELSVEMNRLKDAECYLNLTLFTDADLDKINEICDNENEAGQSAANETATEQFIDMIQSLANRCNTTNKELDKELQQKRKESLHKQRLNARKHNIDKIRDETRLMHTRISEMKPAVANRAKELVGYE